MEFPYKSKVINDLSLLHLYDTSTKAELTTLADVQTALAAGTLKFVIDGWGQFGSETGNTNITDVNVWRGNESISEETTFSEDTFQVTAPAVGQDPFVYIRFNLVDKSYSSRLAQAQREDTGTIGPNYQVRVTSSSSAEFLAKLVNQMLATPRRFPVGPDNDLLLPTLLTGAVVTFIDKDGVSQTETLAVDWNFNDEINGLAVDYFVSIAGATTADPVVKLVMVDEDITSKFEVLSDLATIITSPLVVVDPTALTRTQPYKGRGTYKFLDSSVVLNNEVNNTPDFAVMNDERPIPNVLYTNITFSSLFNGSELGNMPNGNYSNSNAIVSRKYNYELWFNESLALQFGASATPDSKSSLIIYALSDLAGNSYKFYNENYLVPGAAGANTLVTGTTAWTEASASGAERVNVSDAILAADVETFID